MAGLGGTSSPRLAAGGRAGGARPTAPAMAPPQRHVPGTAAGHARGRTSMTPETLAALEAAKRDGRPVVLATRLPDGEQRLLPDPASPPELNEAADHALRRRRKRHGQARRQRLVPARLQPAAAPDRGRRGAYRAGAGAVRLAMRLRGHRGRSAPVLRLRRALPQRHHLHRLAGRGDGRAAPRHPHRGGDADARSEAGRSGAGPRAEVRRRSTSARSAPGAPMRRG